MKSFIYICLERENKKIKFKLIFHLMIYVIGWENGKR